MLGSGRSKCKGPEVQWVGGTGSSRRLDRRPFKLQAVPVQKGRKGPQGGASEMKSQLVCQWGPFRLSTGKHHVYTIKHTLNACYMHDLCMVSGM